MMLGQYLQNRRKGLHFHQEVVSQIKIRLRKCNSNREMRSTGKSASLHPAGGNITLLMDNMWNTGSKWRAISEKGQAAENSSKEGVGVHFDLEPRVNSRESRYRGQNKRLEEQYLYR